MARPRRQDPPEEVAAIRAEIRRFFATQDQEGRRLGTSKYGIYLFYDYDREPIYVGQTVESLSTRIGRHMTGQRSDAVAKFVLDPFEVLEIEAWPMPDLVPDVARATVDRAEYAVYRQALAASAFGAILNEGTILQQPPIELPQSYRQRIVPDAVFRLRQHPDIRLARRAQTIASLARVISEREPSTGLRETLRVQARRLESLATLRLGEFAGPIEEMEDVAAEAAQQEEP